MIKPETSDFFGNELDKAKLEIVSYWKDKYEKTRKALDVALDWLEQVATPAKCDDELCREFTSKKLVEIKTALEKSELENLEMLVNNVFK